MYLITYSVFLLKVIFVSCLDFDGYGVAAIDDVYHFVVSFVVVNDFCGYVFFGYLVLDFD